jgi:hypothetical protein
MDHHYMEVNSLITKIAILLWEENLMGIGKEAQSPKDEFLLEAKQIAAVLGDIDDEEILTYKIIAIINESFEPFPPYDYDSTHELAHKIYVLSHI